MTGDSKTKQFWQTTFETALDPLLPSHYYVVTRVQAHEADLVADCRAAIDARLAAVSDTCDYAFVNIGINDIQNGLPVDRAQVEGDLVYILNAIHAKWPGCRIMVAKIWSLQSDGSDADTFDDVWIPSVLAACPFAEVGVDERIWIKADDNGATNTYDGVHYSDPAGFTAISNGWIDTMGY